MNDASPSGHPLNITSTECAFMSSKILMREAPFQCVRYCFKSSVWVIWESSGQFDFGIIEHQEWVKCIQAVGTDESSDFGSDSLALLFRGESLSYLFEMLCC